MKDKVFVTVVLVLKTFDKGLKKRKKTEQLPLLSKMMQNDNQLCVILVNKSAVSETHVKRDFLPYIYMAKSWYKCTKQTLLSTFSEI